MQANEEKFKKLLELLDEEDYYINDFIAVVCCMLCSLSQDKYATGLKIGDSFFDVSITKRRLS